MEKTREIAEDVAMMMKSLSGTTSCHAGSSDQYCAIDIVSVFSLSSCGKIENFSLARNDLINMLIFGFRIFVDVDDDASISSFECLVEIGGAFQR